MRIFVKFVFLLQILEGWLDLFSHLEYEKVACFPTKTMEKLLKLVFLRRIFERLCLFSYHEYDKVCKACFLTRNMRRVVLVFLPGIQDKKVGKVFFLTRNMRRLMFTFLEGL